MKSWKEVLLIVQNWNNVKNKYSSDMKEQMLSILLNYIGSPEKAIQARTELLDLFIVSNNALIDYIEHEAEVLIPIEEMFNNDGTHITKKEYGKVVIKYLAKELREHYC